LSPILVQKFGGTSVADAPALRRVFDIVGEASRRGSSPVVVTSAMSGVTDGLLKANHYAIRHDLASAHAGLEPLIARHRDVATALLKADTAVEFHATLDETKRELLELLRVVRDHPGTRHALEDEIVSQGERLSSRLLALVLRDLGLPSCWVDARACVRTDDQHTRAIPLHPQTDDCTRAQLLPLLEQGQIPVLGGFIGSTLEHATTTLGRGGSDFSAALVGAALRAEEIQIWTDVNGFLTADPRVVPHAATIAQLSYEEAAELAYFGAKVLHPRTIQPAVEAGLPVRICNSRLADAPGTVVDGRREVSPHGIIKAIAHKRGITVVQVSSARMLGAYGFLRALFEIFDKHRTSVDIVATSEVSVSLTVDDTTRLPAIVEELSHLGDVSPEAGYAIVCVVGEGLRSTPGVAAKVFGALQDINIVLVSQGASMTNFTFVVHEDVVHETVTRLHDAFFGSGAVGTKGARVSEKSARARLGSTDPHSAQANPSSVA
jgi:aspartate kinase